MVNKEHLTQEGLNKIIKISEGMNTKRDYSLVQISSHEVVSDWLLGFCDAEGDSHSRVTPNKTSKLGFRVIVFFSIYQHGRDYSTLTKIQNFFGCGTVIKKINRNNESFEFKVSSISDLHNYIIPFFNKNN